MSKLAKALTAAAGNAGGESLYVEDVFSTYLYTGNGGTEQAIVNNVDLLNEGGLAWIKERANAGNESHQLFDTERGSTLVLHTEGTSGNSNYGTAFKSFNSDGFSVQDSGYAVNDLNATYASWTFRKAEKFFDVVTYTGTGSAQTIAHNLGSAPACMIVKQTSGSTQQWNVYHASLGYTQYMYLSGTNSAATYSGIWQAEPTSSVFSVGDDAGTNASGATYVAYLFASDAGGFGDDGSESIIKCGSYTTDGSASAQHIDLGFEPQFFIKKKVTSADNWEMYDTMRGWSAPNDTYGVSSAVRLYANLNVAEGATTSSPGPTATGMYFPDGGQSTNATYIYIAIRRPMKTPESGTEVFNGVLTYSDNSTSTGFPVDIGFPVDLAWVKYTTLGAGALWMHRLTGLTSNPQPGKGKLSPADTTAEANSGELWGGDNNTGYRIYGHIYQRICYGFKRATGFFDMVAYTGDGVAGSTQAHNLGVVPELMIVKSRSNGAYNWMVYHHSLGNTNYLRLNEITQTLATAGAWNNTTPTDSEFTLGGGSVTNGSGETFIAYLFATLAGVSKVGSYTGTGADLNVDCGFSAGARFVLIKRTDSTGDWYYWDTIRGIVAGNDPYVLLNTTATQVTSTDYIDPLASGFTVTSTAPAALNASGGTYIFLAIA